MALSSILLSLSFLALTSVSDFPAMGDNIFSTQNHGWCPDDQVKGSCDEVQACIDFLNQRGDTDCFVGDTNNYSAFCEAGNIKILGVFSDGNRVLEVPHVRTLPRLSNGFMTTATRTDCVEVKSIIHFSFRGSS
jgi:hypothetical protein